MQRRSVVNFISQFSSRRGFSLFELLIYVAIFGGTILAISTVLITILAGRDSDNTRFEVLQNVRFVSQKVRQLVYDSTSSTVGGTCPFNTLQVMIEGVTSTIRVEDRALIFTSSGVTSSLTSGLVTATTSANCMFTAIYNPSPAKPTIQFDVVVAYNDNGNPELIFSNSLKTTVAGRQ